MLGSTRPEENETNLIVNDDYCEIDKDIRNFTEFLNNWEPMIEKLT